MAQQEELAGWVVRRMTKVAKGLPGNYRFAAASDEDGESIIRGFVEFDHRQDTWRRDFEVDPNLVAGLSTKDLERQLRNLIVVESED